MEDRLHYWACGVVDISKYHHELLAKTVDLNKLSDADMELVRIKTKEFLESVYAFESHDVFFKPTLASKPDFAHTLELAMDYFCGTMGFATRNHWIDVKFDVSKLKQIGPHHIHMGTYFFYRSNGESVKAHYSFMYNSKGKIILHHSSLPCDSTN